MPKTSQNPGRSGFWSRQSYKDKILIVAFVLQVTISLVLLTIGVLVDDTALEIGGRFALLTGNVVALVAVLQFAISRFFDDQNAQVGRIREEMEGVKDRLSLAVHEIERVTTLSETYVKISRQEESAKSQYQSTLDNFLRRLSNCIDDRRSGALDIMDYYGVLEDLAHSIQGDKESGDTAYEREIWALSFVLDDEWDESSLRETKWISHMQRLDEAGIPTRRLWVFDKKMRAALANEPVEEDGQELIKRLSMYCSDETRFLNTKSYAIPKEEVSYEHFRLFGKGFFAAVFSTGKMRLIRGVCFDNLLSSNSLGGEIDFDEDRIRQIRLQWERYLTLGKPLKDYLLDIGSDSAKKHMQQLWSAKE